MVHPRGDIRVQAVAHHGHFILPEAGARQGFLHNAGVGLAEDYVRPAAGAGLDQRHEGAGIRDEAGFRRTVDVRVGGDIREAGADQVAGRAKPAVFQRRIEGQEHVIRIVIPALHPQGLQLAPEIGISHQKTVPLGEGAQAVVGGGVAGGNHIPVFFRNAHPLQFPGVYGGGAGGIVGQEAGGPPRRAEGFQEIQGAIDQVVSKVKGSVHIQQEAADRPQLFPDFFAAHLLTPHTAPPSARRPRPAAGPDPRAGCWSGTCRGFRGCPPGRPAYPGGKGPDPREPAACRIFS